MRQLQEDNASLRSSLEQQGAVLREILGEREAEAEEEEGVDQQICDRFIIFNVNCKSPLLSPYLLVCSFALYLFFHRFPSLFPQ